MSVFVNPIIGASIASSALSIESASDAAALTTAQSLDSFVNQSRSLQSVLSGSTLRPVSLNSGWTRETVFEKIVDQFLSTMEMNGLDLPPRESITRETVNADFLPDSMARLELVVNLQTEFGLEDIPGEEAETLKTVGAAVDYIAAKLGVTE